MKVNNLKCLIGKRTTETCEVAKEYFYLDMATWVIRLIIHLCVPYTKAIEKKFNSFGNGKKLKRFHGNENGLLNDLRKWYMICALYPREGE